MLNNDDFERLMRYADGELAADAALDLEQRLATDGGARTTLACLRAQRIDAVAAFAAADDAAPLRALTAAIDRGFAARAAARRRRSWGRYAWPAAAMLAIGVLGGVTGFRLAAWHFDGLVERLIAAQAEDRQLMSAAFEQALERYRSGQPVTWRNDASGAAGSITPLRTFKSGSGQWCREFERSLSSPAGGEDRIGVACRAEDGRWLLTLERPKPV